MWDVRQDNDPVAMMQPKESEAKRDCWAVAFGNLLFQLPLFVLSLTSCTAPNRYSKYIIWFERQLFVFTFRKMLF